MESGIIYLREDLIPSKTQRKVLNIYCDSIGFFYYSALKKDTIVVYYHLYPDDDIKLGKVCFSLITTKLTELERNPIIEMIKLSYVVDDDKNLRDIISGADDRILGSFVDCLSKTSHPVLTFFDDVIKELKGNFLDKIIKGEIDDKEKIIDNRIISKLDNGINDQIEIIDFSKDKRRKDKKKDKIDKTDYKKELVDLVKTFREELNTGSGVLDINELINLVNTVFEESIQMVEGDETRECILSVKSTEKAKIKLGTDKILLTDENIKKMSEKDLIESLKILETTGRYLSLKSKIIREIGIRS